MLKSKSREGGGAVFLRMQLCVVFLVWVCLCAELLDIYGIVFYYRLKKGEIFKKLLFQGIQFSCNNFITYIAYCN